MTSIIKSSSAYRTIGEVAKELDLINNKDGSLQTHTLRFWEKQFRQIRPSIKAGKRRYYSKKDFEIIKTIMFYLKVKGFTINGVKKILDSKKNTILDDNDNLSLYRRNLKASKIIKNKVKNISKIVSELKDLK